MPMFHAATEAALVAELADKADSLRPIFNEILGTFPTVRKGDALSEAALRKVREARDLLHDAAYLMRYVVEEYDLEVADDLVHG